MSELLIAMARSFAPCWSVVDGGNPAEGFEDWATPVRGPALPSVWGKATSSFSGWRATSFWVAVSTSVRGAAVRLAPACPPRPMAACRGSVVPDGAAEGVGLFAAVGGERPDEA